MRLGGRKTTVRTVGKLRRSQLITTFGSGAIVDMPRESVIIAGTDYWKHHEQEEYRLAEENLQKLLGVDFFVNPPGERKESTFLKEYGIPAFRFPDWMYCPKCKRLATARVFGFSDAPKCNKCKERLVPSRFVVACENGHLDDFPYEWWVHSDEKCTGKPELYIHMSKESSGLDSIIIECKTCGRKRSMQGSFGRGLMKCTGRRPWLKDKDPSTCDKKMMTVQRGATNLYFGINISALSIPPWSRRIQLELASNWSKLRVFVQGGDRNTFVTCVDAWGLTKKCKCSPEEMWEQALMKYNNESLEGKSWQQILEDEYRAFMIGDEDEDGEFKTRKTKVPGLIEEYVDNIVLASRLREVMALRGFKRIQSEYDIDDNNSFTRLSRDFKNWLPAVELKGEGIFIQLNEQKLREWEAKENVKARYKTLATQKAFSMVKGPGFSPRYILLHTLAHLMIRQLILQCGYASAAIKERIYCTFAESDNPHEMSGILLYTSTNDSEGSLGGLVREGEPDRLDNTFRQMLEAASWCSADPLCIQSKGQGLNALNLAACHSCTLLPETSCENRNCYLDRAALVGTLDDPSVGFFTALLGREE